MWTDGSASATEATSEQARAPLSYTPMHLAEKILTSRSALEGERKQVTVLFADLKGSMELLADRDPEEARQLLDPVLERMMAAVHRYEGTVNQVMGDGIMALFGAPIAHEDHAVRACYAALAMQEAIRRYSEEVRRAHGIEIQIRVGLNSGEVVVRAIGNDLAHGLHGRGPDDAPRGPHGTARDPGSILTDGRDAAAGRGVRAGQAAGPGARSRGCAALWRCSSWRARRRSGRACKPPRRAGSPALWDGRPSWTTLRQAMEQAESRARSGGGGHRRARGGEVPPVLRVHPVPAHAGLARAREPLGLLRQGHPVPARHRPAQGLLPDRRPR